MPRRNKKTSLTKYLVERFEHSERLTLAITPEGTRSRTTQWHTGFLRIANEANIPIVMGVIDFADKRIMIEHTFTPTGDTEADMRAVKDFYRPFKGKHPEKFTAE